MRKLRLSWAVAIVALFIATALAWWKYTPYPSHYISGLRTLGDASTQSLFGVSKDGRGDEWATYIPFLKQAYNEGFPAQSKLAPYYERFDWFIGIPHANLTLLFLPNQIAYWIFPGGKALSLQALYYYTLLLVSILWFSRNIGIRLVIAAPMALAIIFSQLYQVWWTSNFPALAASILPFAVLTSKLGRPYKFLLIYWSACHALFGQLYPPFYIGIAYAVTPFILAVRPDIVRWKEILSAALAGGLALATYYYFNADFVQAVAATSYPGHRLSRGGDSSLSTLLGMLFPAFPARGPADAVYELAVVGTICPLLFIASIPYVEWDKSNRRVTVVTLVTLLLLGFYAAHGIPAWLAKALELSVVPGRRMQLGLSLLVIFYSCYMLSRNLERLRAWPVITVCLGYFGISLLIPALKDIRDVFPGVEYYSLIPLICSVIAVAFFPRARGRTAVMLTLYAAALGQVVIFGAFNPWMRGDDILRPVDSQFVRDYRTLVAFNNGKPTAVVGNLGHLLRGEDLPAYQAIHLANVDRNVYRQLFPSLTEQQFESTFNRIIGISLDNISQPTAAGLTTIFPLQPLLPSLPHSYRQASEALTNILAAPPTIIVDSKQGSYVVRWTAALTKPMPLGTSLLVTVPCKIQASWLARYPIRNDGAPLVSVALQGITGTITLQTNTTEEARDCASGLRVSEDMQPVSPATDANPH
jgi:hypothetical protein